MSCCNLLLLLMTNKMMILDRDEDHLMGRRLGLPQLNVIIATKTLSHRLLLWAVV
jgi:hypothetical protein